MIFVDMDGVLADFVTQAFYELGLRYSTFPKEKMTWNFWEELDYTADEFFGVIEKCGERFWIDIPAYAWMRQLICDVEWASEKMGGEGWAILSSPTNDPLSLSGKVKWLQRHFGREFRDYLLVPSSHKQRLAPGNILIDDFDRNCDQWRQRGGTAILVPQPWNQNKQLTKMRLDYVKSHLIRCVNTHQHRAFRD